MKRLTEEQRKLICTGKDEDLGEVLCQLEEQHMKNLNFVIHLSKQIQQHNAMHRAAARKEEIRRMYNIACDEVINSLLRKEWK